MAAGVSYGAYVPCGLFTPSLLIGSSLGCDPLPSSGNCHGDVLLSITIDLSQIRAATRYGSRKCVIQKLFESLCPTTVVLTDNSTTVTAQVLICSRLYATIIEATLPGRLHLDPGMYALLGAAAFSGGTMRCTVSICVIVLEMIEAAEALPLLMLALIIAKGVADRFNDSIFVKLAISVKKLPYIAQESPYSPCTTLFVSCSVGALNL